MPAVVGIRFRPVTKIYYFDPTGFEDLAVGDYVIVETARGQELGQVIFPPREIPDDEIAGPLKGIMRRATAWDLVQREALRLREDEALRRCKEKAAELGLPMKLIRAEYSFDGSRLVFHFTAEQRVDFRELVQDLARIFRTRIEMHQVGVRDEAKLSDGIGRCGRRLCCSSWLDEFHPVSIRMAKNQELPLTPSEISGLCGRLLCCLAYENEQYTEARKTLPEVGDAVETPHGQGKVIGLNVFTETVSVELESEVTVEVAAQEIKPPRSTGERRSGRKR
jgi:cell fate regulator YaaT (PSP1 superfamily)